MLTYMAPAKINLSLEVTERRPDAFHELVSVIQEVTLVDEVSVAPADEMQLRVDGDCGPESDNLALRAGLMLRKETGTSRGAAIYLRKHIPVGAGLGGGSSDAATTLLALNHLWETGLDCDSLRRLASKLGSDVPFFLYGGTALVTGRGEIVSPLTFPVTAWYVLTNPGLRVPTGQIFRALRQEDWTSGSITRELAGGLRTGRDAVEGINGLAPALFRLYPAARTCYSAAERLAPGRTFVSGSGPTIVSRCAGRQEAQHVAQVLRSRGFATHVVRNCPTEDRELPCRA